MKNFWTISQLHCLNEIGRPICLSICGHCDEGFEWSCSISALNVCVSLQWKIEWHVQFGHLMLVCDYNEGLSASFETWNLYMVNAQGHEDILETKHFLRWNLRGRG
jgi:hypothetical protein